MGHREPFTLLELASRVLCIPASLASSKRLLSEVGLALKKWTKLKSTKVAQLVIVRSTVVGGLLDNY